MQDQFKTEADLCQAFKLALEPDGWTIYPETAGWDMYAVHGRVHLGIQAKLWANIDVLLQSVSWDTRHLASHFQARKPTPGPHFRLVLVGGYRSRSMHDLSVKRSQFVELANSLKIIVASPPEGVWVKTWLAEAGYYRGWRRPFPWFRYRHHPPKVPWLPPFVPVAEAGVPSPSTVSQWMIAAVRLGRLAKVKGWVSTDDAVAVRDQVDGHWNTNTMLQRYFECTSTLVEPGSRKRRWLINPRNDPEKRYPQVAAALIEPVSPVWP